MKRHFRQATQFGLLQLTLIAGEAAAAPPAPQNVRPPVQWEAISMFLLIVAVTLVITKWAAARSRSTAEFYAAGRNVTGLQNGLAIAGDFLSAASFLGAVGLYFAFGFDVQIYSITALAGWPVVLFLFAEKMRNLGQYTLADLLAQRFEPKSSRTFCALASLVIIAFYLTMQMVGAGKLIETLFGLPYLYAEVLVGVLMITYAAFGGMVATTWVQIIKACLLLTSTIVLVALLLARFDFSISTLVKSATQVHPAGHGILAPGLLLKDPVSAISVGMAFVFGTAGLPHILMRFFTVPNAAAARTSAFYATAIIAVTYVLLAFIATGAIALIMTDASFYAAASDGRALNKIGDLIGGINMPAIHLSKALGGPLLQGFISAVAFATILAVVAGLTLAGASAISHDLYTGVISKGQVSEADELRVSRISVIVIGCVAMLLGYLFEKENIAFLASLTFSIAASCNFPILFATFYWPEATTRGVIFGGMLGLLASLFLVLFSPSVWVKVLGHQHALFPYDNPALFSMPVAFLTIWIVSKLDTSQRALADCSAFEGQRVRAETGYGALSAATG